MQMKQCYCILIHLPSRKYDSHFAFWELTHTRNKATTFTLWLQNLGIWKWVTRVWYPTKYLLSPRSLASTRSCNNFISFLPGLGKIWCKTKTAVILCKILDRYNRKEKVTGKFLNTWILITTYSNDSTLSSGSLLPPQRKQAHLCKESNWGPATLRCILTLFSSFCAQDTPQYRIFFLWNRDHQLSFAILLIVFDCLDKHHGRRKHKWWGLEGKVRQLFLYLWIKKKEEIKISHATPSELPLKNSSLTRHEVLSPQA